MIGQLIGNYKIEAKLGEGGMGAVYKGIDTMLDREVAIKALRPELASQDSIVERFRKEAVTLAKLNHPNIATLYTMFRQGDELYMVLEYVGGDTLDSILRQRGPMSADEAIPIFCQVLDGIDHAHDLGIVHRDIKPANMMFTEKGILKVLDFGIARLLGSSRMTRAGNIIGTLEYMAPEQVKGLDTDGRADIYALGMMLYEVLTGRLPFQTENEFELMKAQTEQLPRPPREINPAIPVEVEAAIMKAVQKDPNDRFQTGGEFRECLIGAGFSAASAMPTPTGSMRVGAATPSRPPVSKSTPNPPTEESSIKGTRVGNIADMGLGAAVGSAPALAKSTSGDIAETRLGMAAATSPPVARPDQQASFFSKLTPIHYVGAGVGLLVLIGAFVVVVGGVFVATRSSGTTEATNTTETKPANINQKTETVPVPVKESSPGNFGAPQTQSAPIPQQGQPIPDNLGAPNSPPKDDKTPAAPKTPPAPKKQTPPKPKKKSAEDLLTGP